MYNKTEAQKEKEYIRELEKENTRLRRIVNNVMQKRSHGKNKTTKND